MKTISNIMTWSVLITVLGSSLYIVLSNPEMTSTQLLINYINGWMLMGVALIAIIVIDSLAEEFE